MENFFYHQYVGTITIFYNPATIDNSEAWHQHFFYLEQPNIYGERGNWDEDDVSASVTMDVVPAIYSGNTLLDLDLFTIF